MIRLVAIYHEDLLPDTHIHLAKVSATHCSKFSLSFVSVNMDVLEGAVVILTSFIPMRIRLSLFRNWRLKVNCVKLNIISWKRGTGNQP